MLSLTSSTTVELSTLTIDESGRPVAHIFKPHEIDACELLGVRLASALIYPYAVLEKEGLKKAPEEASA